MKIYSFDFNANAPAGQRFWVNPHSDYKIAVKVFKDGAALSGVTLSAAGQALSADEEEYAGYTTFTFKSQGPGSTGYTVGASGTEQKFKLLGVVPEGTVFYTDDAGGSIPADYASMPWVQEQISDFVTESDVTAIVDSSTSDFVDAQQVADQIALNEDGFAKQADVDTVSAGLSALSGDVDLLSVNLGMFEGNVQANTDAIGYISSEVSADVDSTNVKHISACYLTDYVELSTSGTPDPDTLYFCVG